MSLINKDYFRLDEVIDDLGLSYPDVLYLAETGQLRLSIRVFSLAIEKGYIEEVDEGRWCNVPDYLGRLTGLLDICDRDAHEILKTGSANIHYFHAAEGRYCACSQYEPDYITVKKHDLLVILSERKSLEQRLRQQTITARRPEQPSALAPNSFLHNNDYSVVQLGGEIYSLGPYQAAVVRILHEAAKEGNPWCKGVDILAEIKCRTQRISDLFKSQPNWRKLIESNKRGMWCLAIYANL